MSDLRNATDRVSDAVQKYIERKNAQVAELQKQVADLTKLVEDLRANSNEEAAAAAVRLNALAEAVEKA